MVLDGVGFAGLGAASCWRGAGGVCAPGTVWLWRAGVIGGSGLAGGDGAGTAVVWVEAGWPADARCRLGPRCFRAACEAAGFGLVRANGAEWGPSRPPTPG
jgi:hypothetical protein